MLMETEIKKLENKIQRQGREISKLKKRIRNANIEEVPINEEMSKILEREGLLIKSCLEYEETINELTNDIAVMSEEIFDLLNIISES
tara:strand:- start:398 stop:661 length:264 start_codon:yes stop_codon:yes gene_type:complete